MEKVDITKLSVDRLKAMVYDHQKELRGLREEYQKSESEIKKELLLLEKEIEKKEKK